MPTDNSNLEKRRQGYYAVLDVPPSLRALVGRKRLRKTLKTRSLDVARRRRRAVLAMLQERIDAARGQKAETDAASWWAEAKEYRELLNGPLTDHDKATLEESIVLQAEKLAETRSEQEGVAFADAAFGRTTLLSPLFEIFFREHRVREKTKDEYRRTFDAFCKWLRATKTQAPVAEVVTRRVAGEFVSTHLIDERGLTAATINKAVTGLSAFWKWMIKKGHVTENPWTQQGVSKKSIEAERARTSSEPRPFTDDEVKKLLADPPDDDLRDMMRIAALSGMRIESIATLTVGACADGVFNVANDKTAAGRRQVPIHSALAATIEERTKGRASTDFLFKDLSADNKYGKRAAAISKRFSRYRVGLGIDEKAEGQRNSAVNFHSFRRWFIQRAEWAGQPPHIIESVVGHKRQGMTLGTYSKESSEAQHRACVEAVKLP